jgi:hypothetical protein
LKAAVDIDIILLGVVLNKCCPENTVAEINFYSWGDEE